MSEENFDEINCRNVSEFKVCAGEEISGTVGCWAVLLVVWV